MRLTKAQRAALGIPDGATTEQVKKILSDLGLPAMADGDTYEEDNGAPSENPAEKPAATPPVASTPSPVPTALPTPAAPAPTPAVTPAPEKVAAAAGPPTAEAVMLAAGQLGLTVVDTAMFSQLKDDAAAGRAARDEQNNARWDAIVQTAVRQGKLAASAFATWRENIAKNPDLVIKLIAALPDSMPTGPIGKTAEAYAALPGASVDADSDAGRVAKQRELVFKHFGIDPPATGN